jgi:hypothetical protein
MIPAKIPAKALAMAGPPGPPAIAPVARRVVDGLPLLPRRARPPSARPRGCWLGLLTLGAGLAGCAGAVGSGTAASPGPGPGSGVPGGGTNSSGTATSGGGTATTGTGAGSTPALPPEVEVESSYEAPIATGRYVWIANPKSGRVAYVDSATLAVDSVEAGNAPTYVAPVPGAVDAVVVLNVLSHDATYLRANPATATGPATLTNTMIPHVALRANSWGVSADGRWALAWSDVRRVAAASSGGVLAAADVLEGFQDVTAIDLAATPPVATTMAVGYRPVSVAFSSDGTWAFAVTEDGVSAISLPAAMTPAAGTAATIPKVVRNVPLEDDLSAGAAAAGSVAGGAGDVSIASAGGVNRAVVRRDGASEIRVVDLDSGSATALPLDGPATDLDVTSDGTRAVAVVRETGSVFVIPLTAAVPTAASMVKTTLAGAIIGSVVLTSDSATAILYSNAVESEVLVVLDLASGASHPLRAHAGVLSVFPTPDGQYAVILHRASADTAGTGGAAGGLGTGGADPNPGGGGAGGGGGATGSGGAAPLEPAMPGKAFSIVPLDGSRSGRIQGTEAVPQSIGIGPASDRVLVTVRDDVAQVYAVYVATLPSLEVDRFALASPPLVAGAVAGVAGGAGKGYVAQEHPEGRITFIPFDGTSLRTITGFELGARVVDGVGP